MLRSVFDAVLVRPTGLFLRLLTAVLRVLLFPLLQMYYLGKAIVLLPLRLLLYFEVCLDFSRLWHNAFLSKLGEAQSKLSRVPLMALLYSSNTCVQSSSYTHNTMPLSCVAKNHISVHKSQSSSS
jgi:hypothetical protein